MAGALVIGQGFILGNRRLMHYSPVNPPVNIRMAAFSSGFGHAANWSIPLLDSKYLILCIKRSTRLIMNREG